MDERFPDEFVTWRHKTAVGVKVDEVFGMDSKSGNTWISLAKQIFSEQGDQNYRVMVHFDSGAPLLEGYPGRISVTHTNHFLAVAFLPKTPETDLGVFNPRTAMGIDAESLTREQVLKVRSKFLNREEEMIVPQDDLQKNILAWTSKEALYKAALGEAKDFREDIRILKLPTLSKSPMEISDQSLGQAEILIPGEKSPEKVNMKLFSYESYGCAVTIACSPKCARFGK